MQLSRRGLLSLGAGAALMGGWTAARAADAVDPIQTILDETGNPALIGVVVTTTGISHTEVRGVRRLGAPDLVTANDLWHLGSNAKAMTAALYGRMVEKGRAKWGATVPELFPDLTVDLAWKATTIEQLLGHRAGVEERSLMMSGWLGVAHQDTRPLREQRMDAVKTMFGKAPGGTPGQFAYANLNYVIAGAAIERIANATWEEAIMADLFKPLGMTTTGFGAPQGANPWGHRPATMGAQTPPIKLTPVDPAGRSDNPRVLAPAGGAHMSMTDYAKFVRLFLTKGGDVLKPATVEHLTTPVPGEGRPYALGWGVSPDRPWAKGPSLGHEGSNTMWHALATVAPARGLAIIVGGNAPPPTMAGQRLARSLQERFIAA